MRSRTLPPPPDLADIVESFWTTGWDLGDAVHEVQILTDPSVHLVIEAGADRVVGVYTRLWTRRLQGRSVIWAAKLRPGAVASLLHGPAHTLAGRTLPWTSFWPAPPTFSDDETAFAWLAAHLRAHRRPADLDAVHAVQRARDDSALRSVEALAKSLGTTPRSLQRLFKRHVGASPKWVLRRFRLQEAARRVELGQAPSLADLAFDLGYADQAHLARDFKAAVGTSLRAFEARVAGPGGR